MMPYINSPNTINLCSFLESVSKHKIYYNLEAYYSKVKNIFDNTVHGQFPLLDLVIPNNGSLAYFQGFSITKRLYESLPLKENDPKLSCYGMPMVGVMQDGFDKKGVLIFDAYRCINLDAFDGANDACRHVNWPSDEWNNIPSICTHKRTKGITANTCMSLPISAATAIYLEYLRMDRTNEPFRIASWPHGG
jgi:hypothetical protein